MEEILIGCCSLVSMVMLVAMCMHTLCVKKKSQEELQKERFERFSKRHMVPRDRFLASRVDFVRRPEDNLVGIHKCGHKERFERFSKRHMVPRDRFLASRVDFVRRPEDNLDNSQSSVTGRSEHTYEDISLSTPSKHDISVPPRSPSSSIEKCIIVDEHSPLETSESFVKDTDLEDTVEKHTDGRWLQTPGRLASYISFRQTSHSVLAVPSTVNITVSDSREHSDSDNNSMDCGSEVADALSVKPLNLDNHSTETKTVIKSVVKVIPDENDFNLSCNYDKAAKKEFSSSQMSWKSDPTYESIRSLAIPKIKVHAAKKSGSGSSEHTYESLNSELCYELGRSDVFDRVPDGESDTCSFKRSFESVKSGRDFTVFEINCDDDGNDLFPEYLSSSHFNQSINTSHSSRHSYPGQIQINKSGDKSDLEDRYSPFPVSQKLSTRHKSQQLSASPRFSMIQTVSGNLKPKARNLRPKACSDQEEYPVLNTPQSIPKIKVNSSDCVFLNSSISFNSERDTSLPDILENTASVNIAFDGEDEKIPPLKTYQTLRSMYSNARRASRTKRSLMSLPSLTEQTELEIDQHLNNNMYVKSTPLPKEELTSVFSSWGTEF